MPARKPKRPAPVTLRKWRLYRGMTLEQVGAQLNVGHQAVHKWETGKTPVDLETLRLLAQVYRTTPDALLYEPSDSDLVARMRRAHDILRSLPDDRADQWLGVGEAMTPPGEPDAG